MVVNGSFGRKIFYSSRTEFFDTFRTYFWVVKHKELVLRSATANEKIPWDRIREIGRGDYDWQLLIVLPDRTNFKIKCPNEYLSFQFSIFWNDIFVERYSREVVGNNKTCIQDCNLQFGEKCLFFCTQYLLRTIILW